MNKNKKSAKIKNSDKEYSSKAPTLSLCMIVKNEEGLLGQCLESVKDCVDEIVIVDTGSTDRTVEIAKEYGAQIYHHPWEDDFSKHQNQSVEYATGDWILQMDADEELTMDSCSALRQALTDREADAFLVSIRSFFNKGASCSRESKIRIFRNRPGIRYEGIVHKQLKGFACQRVAPVVINHYGYDLELEAMAEKCARTIALLEKQISTDPENYWHRHNLAVSSATVFRFDDAVKEGRKALELAAKQNLRNHNLSWTHYVVASSYFKLGDMDQAERYALEGLEFAKDHLDSLFVLILVYHARKHWDKLEASAKQFRETLEVLNESPERCAQMVLHAAAEGWRVSLALGDMYLNKGKVDEAQVEFESAQAQTPTQAECFRMIGDFYRESGFLEMAEKNCQKAVEVSDKEPEILLSLAKLEKARGNQEAYITTLERTREVSSDDPEVLKELGMLDLIEGRYEEATKAFTRITEISSASQDIIINLALAHKYLGNRKDAVKYNLEALERHPDSIDGLVNLGHLYYETGDHQSAKEHYERALTLDRSLLAAALRLATVYLIEGNADGCIALCDAILAILHLPRNIVLNSLDDLADVFKSIAQELLKTSQKQLSIEALDIAHKLNPDLGTTLSSPQSLA